MQAKTSSLLHAILVFAVLLLMISFGMFALKISLNILLFFVIIWVSLNARYLGYDFTQIRQMMNDSLSRSLSAIYIFCLIGIVIASFMHSGTVASLIYYGLDWISAQWFLPVGLILCSIMSISIGTSWGTVGTLGVVFMGIGGVLNIPLPMVAGMVISGATFGDKLSPVSDTTNLAAMSSGTDLYAHIKSMMYTTIPSYLIVLIAFAYMGYQADNTSSFSEITAIQTLLSEHYQLNFLITLTPLVVMLVMSVKKFAPEVTMTSSIVVACIIAVFYQGDSTSEVANALWQNKATDTGNEMIDKLLGRGGLFSMAETLLLSILAIAMGGILHGAGFLTVLLKGVISRIKRAGSLVAATITTSFVGNLSMGDSYIAILLNGQLYKNSYDEKGIDKSVLSRSVEEGATLTTALIPWNNTAVFYFGTLNISAIEYGPYALLNYINPLLAIVFAYLGIALFKAKTAVK